MRRDEFFLLGVAIVDERGRYLYLNPTFTAMFGYTRITSKPDGSSSAWPSLTPTTAVGRLPPGRRVLRQKHPLPFGKFSPGRVQYRL
jgi:PAS domain-containing protein